MQTVLSTHDDIVKQTFPESKHTSYKKKDENDDIHCVEWYGTIRETINLIQDKGGIFIMPSTSLSCGTLKQ
jgi:hypothetical protein